MENTPRIEEYVTFQDHMTEFGRKIRTYTSKYWIVDKALYFGPYDSKRAAELEFENISNRFGV